jgi:hypothetical protein
VFVNHARTASADPLTDLEIANAVMSKKRDFDASRRR